MLASMPYDRELAARIRTVVAGEPGLTVKGHADLNAGGRET